MNQLSAPPPLATRERSRAAGKGEREKPLEASACTPYGTEANKRRGIVGRPAQSDWIGLGPAAVPVRPSGVSHVHHSRLLSIPFPVPHRSQPEDPTAGRGRWIINPPSLGRLLRSSSSTHESRMPGRPYLYLAFLLAPIGLSELARSLLPHCCHACTRISAQWQRQYTTSIALHRAYTCIRAPGTVDWWWPFFYYYFN